MTTRGDQILDRTLSKVGGKGLFVKELETALEEGRADLAVHSLKDVPMDLPAGFVLAAVLEREDPRDAFVSPRYATLAALPQGARGRHVEPAPRGAAARAAARPAHRAAARQPRHAAAQARRRRVRRHRAGRGRARSASAWPTRIRARFEPDADAAGGRAGRAGASRCASDDAALARCAGAADPPRRPGWRCMPSARCRARSAAAAACRWPPTRAGHDGDAACCAPRSATRGDPSQPLLQRAARAAVQPMRPRPRRWANRWRRACASKAPTPTSRPGERRARWP